MEDFVMHTIAPIFIGIIMIGVAVLMVGMVVHFIREFLN
jgi:hypothetical protein